MDFRRLEVFAKIAELSSFSRAAEALSLTQPTVSEHMRTLETELGVLLLDRLGRGATPTPAGRLLLTYARRILALTREAEQALDDYQGRMGGPLLVGASTIPAEYVLPALIGRFKMVHPEISATLLVGGSRHIGAWVEEGRVELGVVGAPPSSRALLSTELMSDEQVVVVPSGHPWAGTDGVTLAELKTEPLMVREPGSGSRACFEKALDDAGLALPGFRVVGEMGSTQAIKQAVRAGVGVAVISRRAVEDEVRAGVLATVPLRDRRLMRAFHLVKHRERTQSPVARAFEEFLASHVVADAS